MIPVIGVRHEELSDTFKDARSENRVHDAIDIIAAHNTPVVAAVDGEIARFLIASVAASQLSISADKKLFIIMRILTAALKICAKKNLLNKALCWAMSAIQAIPARKLSSSFCYLDS
jgi:hypothetical protein